MSPSLRTHIELARKAGISLPAALSVNFLMGLEEEDSEETDLSELTDKELSILETEFKQLLGRRPKEIEGLLIKGATIIEAEWMRRKK